MKSLHRLASRMAHIDLFEAMEIQTRARALEAAGFDVIHMEIGEPDFATPQPINDAAKHALDRERISYTSALGMLSLRHEIAGHYLRQHGVTIDPSRIIVTAGSSAALLLVFAVLLNDGDEVLMADPSYPCNRHFVRTMGGVARTIATDASCGFQLNAAHVAQHWRTRCVATLVASPSNPTGSIITPDELTRIHAAVSSRSGSLIVDEIYQGLTYDVAPTTALALEIDQANLFVINSFSKYFHMTGWRLGWMVAPSAYVRDLEKLAQNLFISPSALAQHAAHAAFTPETMAIVEGRRIELQARRDFLIGALRELGFVIEVVPQGAFYIYANCAALWDDSFVLARRLLEEAHVAVTPGKDFGASAPEKYIRFAYTQPISRLREATTRIAAMLGL